jgi:hypothetical protein
MKKDPRILTRAAEMLMPRLDNLMHRAIRSQRHAASAGSAADLVNQI